jgi:hypothetical protein
LLNLSPDVKRIARTYQRRLSSVDLSQLGLQPFTDRLARHSEPRGYLWSANVDNAQESDGPLLPSPVAGDRRQQTGQTPSSTMMVVRFAHDIVLKC